MKLDLAKLDGLLVEARAMHVVPDRPGTVNSPSHGEPRLDPLITEIVTEIRRLLASLQ